LELNQDILKRKTLLFQIAEGGNYYILFSESEARWRFLYFLHCCRKVLSWNKVLEPFFGSDETTTHALKAFLGWGNLLFVKT